MLRVEFKPGTAEYLKNKGGNLLIFLGSYSGCFVGKVPAIMLDSAMPRGNFDSYSVIKVEGVNVYMDSEISKLSGVIKVWEEKNLIWSNLYHEYLPE